VESSDLPANAAEATVDVQPETVKSSDDIKAFDDLTDVIISSFPKFGGLKRPAKRIIACAILSDLYSNVESLQPGVVETEPVLQILLLDTCLRVALRLSSQQPHGAAAGARLACRRFDSAIVLRVTRTCSGYRGQTVGTTHKPTGRSPLSISCRPRGKGFRLTIRPRARGRKLRQVVGPTLGIGFRELRQQARGRPHDLRGPIAARSASHAHRHADWARAEATAPLPGRVARSVGSNTRSTPETPEALHTQPPARAEHVPRDPENPARANAERQRPAKPQQHPSCHRNASAD
jgi:hypothetical protein